MFYYMDFMSGANKNILNQIMSYIDLNLRNEKACFIVIYLDYYE